MPHKNHVIDRTPYICPAGIHNDYSGNVSDCLKYCSLEDKVTALKHEAFIPDKPPQIKYKQPILENTRNIGLCTEIRQILQPPVKTRFQTLINDLKETTYKSYWDNLEGKKRDPTGKLPIEVDPYSTTFGSTVKKDCTVQELVSPAKSYGQVLDEYTKGHEIYKKSHNDYYVNEHINRNYLRPCFNPNQVFGQKTTYDPRGIYVKCCMAAKDKNDLTVANSIQAEFQDKHVSKLGKSLSPNNNIECVPKGHTYGIASSKSHGVAELLNENPTSVIQKDIEHYMTYINPLRLQLKKRFNKNLFDFSKFLDSLRYYDVNNSGWISLSVAYEICLCYNITFDKKIMEQFLTLLNIVKDGNLNYSKFVDVLNWQADFPDIASVYYVPNTKQYYETTSVAAANDYKIIDNSKLPPAGMASIRTDISVPVVPIGGCKADMDSFGGDTDASTIMYPSIYTSYGLSFYDFFQPRDKIEMRNIFKTIGYEINDEVFEKLWAEGCIYDKTGLVCVDTFKNLVHKYGIKYNTRAKQQCEK